MRRQPDLKSLGEKNMRLSSAQVIHSHFGSTQTVLNQTVQGRLHPKEALSWNPRVLKIKEFKSIDLSH